MNDQPDLLGFTSAKLEELDAEVVRSVDSRQRKAGVRARAAVINVVAAGFKATA